MSSFYFYDLKYHVVWTPKYRGKIFQLDYIKKEMTRMIKTICQWKKVEVFEINVQEDHVHMCLGIPPKHSISYVMSLIKGKSFKWIKKKNKKVRSLCHKGSLWARGYFISTIGLDEYIVRRYVKHQSKHNQIEQPTLWQQLFAI